MGLFPPQNANERLFLNGDQFFAEMLQSIDMAQKEVLVESYIFRCDTMGKRLIKSLLRARRRGVRVIMMVDAIGSFGFQCRYWKLLRKKGIHFRFFRPLPFQKNPFSRCPFSFLYQCFRAFFLINKRNHRKMIMIDKEKAFVGSLNITSLHCLKLSGNRAWRDTGIQVTDSRNQYLRKSFLDAFFQRSSEIAFESIQAGLRLNPSDHLREKFSRDLIQRINNAQVKIWITNPYFVPSAEMLIALKKAGQRGVDVRILLPRKSDMSFFPLINYLSYRSLLGPALKVYEYLPRILHAKTLIIDDWAIVGSSNLNHRSLLHDLELDVVLSQEESKEILRKSFLEDLRLSKKVLDFDLQKRYGRLFFSHYFIKLVRYWI